MTDFYNSKEWSDLKKRAYKRYGRKCMATGLTEKDGITLSIDHVVPRSKSPQLALKLSNVQVLEAGLNRTKSNRANWDFRPKIWKMYYGVVSLLKRGLIISLLITMYKIVEYDNEIFDFCNSILLYLERF